MQMRKHRTARGFGVGVAFLNAAESYQVSHLQSESVYLKSLLGDWRGHQDA